MKSLFAGQKVWLWYQLDAETRERVFHALNENGAPLQEGDWMQGEHSKEEFLVVDDVQKEEIQELSKKGGTIIGVECVNQSVEQRRPLPKLGRILCCRALEGHKICLTGFSGFEKERTRLSSWVLAMGAEVTNNFDGTITTVVSKNIINDKCKWAVKMKKPVVTTKWVEECWAEHAASREEDFRLPVFCKLKVCCTSLKAPDKDKVKELVWANGGTFDADLDSTCTHLVCGSTNSKKYQVATKRDSRLKVVTPEWIYKSVAAKGCLDETPFAPPPPNDAALPAALRSASQTSFGQTTRLASGTQGSLTLTRVVATPTPTDDESLGRAESGKHASTAGREAICYDDDDKLFLSSCRLYFSGMTREELQEAMGIMRASGATRYALLDERATHVVLGDSPDCDLTEVRKLDLEGIVEVVRLSWLRACLQYRKLLPVADKYRVPRDQLTAARASAKPEPTASARPSQKQGLLQQVPASRPAGGPVPDDDDSPNEPGSSEWEKLRESQRQVSQRPREFSENGSRGGFGEGSGEAGNDPPVMEMRSDIFDDASRTGFGPGGIPPRKPVADVSARMPVLGKRFMSPKRGDTWQKEGAASPKLAAAFSAEGGGGKTVMGPPGKGRKWLEAARNPVKFSPGCDNQAGNPTVEAGQSEDLNSGRLRPGLQNGAGVKASGCEGGTPGGTQSTPAGSQIPETSDVFQGLRFNVDVRMKAEDREEIQGLVRKGAGDLETDPSKSVHYFVVQHGFDTNTTTVPDGADVVTPYWVVQCLKEQRLVPQENRLYFRPLPRALPLDFFRGITVCLSKYEQKEHEWFRDLAKRLGAKSFDRLTNTVTHVVTKYADGDKYRHMVRKGKPVATGEWLIACAKQGCLVPVEDYAPPSKPTDVTCAPSQAGGIAPSQLEARSPGDAEQSAPGQSSMPPPRTRGTGRAGQSSQHASQPQRKRPKKESPPQPRPGDFEKLDDFTATWTFSQAPSPGKSAKSPLNLAGPSFGVNTPSGGANRSGDREGPRDGPGESARGGGVNRGPAPGGADNLAGTAEAERKRTPHDDVARESKTRGAEREQEEAVTSASEPVLKKGLRGPTPVGGSSEGRELDDETPSKNLRSRRGVPPEPKAAPPSRGKRKSDERDSPGDSAPDSQEKGRKGGGAKQRKSADAAEVVGGGHVAAGKEGNVAGGQQEEAKSAEKGRVEVGIEATSEREDKHGLGCEGVVDGQKRSPGEAGAPSERGPEGDAAGQSPEGDRWAHVLESFLHKIPEKPSAPIEEKRESGLGDSDSKRPRIGKTWPGREPAALAPHAADGPWTRQRTAVAPAVAEDERFQESQLESQMVGYDDGTAQKQVILEQIRRSGRLSGSVSAGGSRNASRRPKNDGIRNLLATANGNVAGR
ncbi:BRCT domain-containing protein [Klebsormidium nitens]|uniref:BRCT domain-containing protein n=1 Tax=Klebsormidium nitens TaxID=105231 RepID=A0A1Y1HWC9_KLENI|nr:BRCT domain-containing protein [Klebsormidium nitens]|eukprot:GAQ80806.1 BRCT domain-containing protein [Klebsormidium nitens]